MSLVVLLRGVNVGGHKTFSPKKLAERLKHFEVVNIGAAGTFVVRKKTTQADVRKAFARELPFETSILICPGRDITQLISDDPFARQEKGSDIVRFVSILDRKPKTDPKYPYILPPGGKWLVKLIGRRARYVLGMYRRSMQTITYLSKTDKLFDVPVTTRNWNTIEAIGKALK